MSAQASEDCAGQRAGVFDLENLQRYEEDGRSDSELENSQDLETPGIPSLHVKAPWGPQVCLHLWGEGVLLASAWSFLGCRTQSQLLQ